MKKTLKHLLPALFLAAVMALLTGCTKSVDLLQYADVTFDGASGNATATVTLDYNSLGKELLARQDRTLNRAEPDGPRQLPSPPDRAVNGDTVTLTVSADDT
ncbi:MAG: hypothetical protein ACLUFT_12900 [Gemmiger formicilis]|uniref:hypothetical protein n=1 Tax=Gemmiger formicilis TaxID=745368 RepID=UPI00399655EA